MEEERRKVYPSDLTDAVPVFGGLRAQMETAASFCYIQRYTNFYRHAQISGLWDKILEQLVKKTRTSAGRKKGPSCGPFPIGSVGFKHAVLTDSERPLPLCLTVSAWPKCSFRMVGLNVSITACFHNLGRVRNELLGEENTS